MADKSASRFYLAMAACLLLGVGGLFCPHPHVREVTTAFLIAGLLGLTVDGFVKERLARAVSHDVLAATFGIQLPVAIRDEIVEIAAHRVVRRNVDLVYKIRPHATDQNFVDVTAALAYQVENLCDETIKYDHLIWVQKPWQLSAPFQQVQYAKVRGLGSADDYELSGTALIQQDDPVEFGVFWSKTLELPAKRTVDIWSRSQQILPAEHLDVFTLIAPSVGVKVRIDAPPELQGTVIFNHRKNHEAVRAGDVWELRAGFVPRSTVSIEWRRRAIPTPAPAVPTPPPGTSGVHP